MFKTIITKSPNKRICEIFKSNSEVDFNFFPYYQYEELAVDEKFIADIHNGYFNWIIFTSYRSWKFLNKSINSYGMNINKKIKIAVFGSESASRVKESGGRVEFIKNVNNASEFSKELIKNLITNARIAYPASSAATDSLQKIFLRSNIQIIRQDIYKPNSILDTGKIKEIIYELNPDSIVFFSAGSANLFMNNCTEELLNKIKNMKIFAIGKQTAYVLEKYTDKDISIPDYPNIKMLSKMICDFASYSKRD